MRLRRCRGREIQTRALNWSIFGDLSKHRTLVHYLTFQLASAHKRQSQPHAEAELALVAERLLGTE